MANRLRSEIPIQYGKTRFPKSIKELFWISEIITGTDPILGPAIYTLASYPIQEYSLEGGGKFKDEWQDIFDNIIFLNTETVSAGIDFFEYGNSFRSIIFYKSNFIVTEDRLYPIESVSDLNLEVKDNRIVVSFIDPSTKKRKKGEIRAIGSRSKENIKIYRWNPYYMDIYWIETAQHPIYYYIFPKSDIHRVEEKDPAALSQIPYPILIEILKGNKFMRIPNKIIFHFKRPSPFSLLYPGWGIPITLWSIKEYSKFEMMSDAQILMIMRYALPFIIFFPQPLANFDPTRLPLRKWSQWLRESIKRFSQNPGAPQFAPFPIGAQVAGPTLNQLSLTNETLASREIMIGSLGIPKEFIIGGGTYTGAAHASRVMSNKFSGYLKTLKKYVDFIIEKISFGLGWDPVKVRFQPVKLSDEIQRINLLLQLVQGKLLSPAHLLKELGIYDIKKEMEDVEEYLKQRTKMDIDLQVEQEKIKNEAIQNLGPGAQFNPSLPARIVAELLLKMPQDKVKAYFNKIQEVAPEFGDLVAQELDNLLNSLSPSEKEELESSQEEGNFQAITNPKEKPEEEKIKARED